MIHATDKLISNKISLTALVNGFFTDKNKIIIS